MLFEAYLTDFCFLERKEGDSKTLLRSSKNQPFILFA